jgi:hypothetical protein
VRTSATAANAALPGQLNESSARSFTTFAIIFTLPPPSSSGVGNALNVHANTTSDADAMPGIVSGSVTRRKIRRGEAPRLAAARSYVGSTWLIAAARMRIIVGMEKWTSPTRTPDGSNSSFTGHRMNELPSTSIHAYVRTIAPVKNGASVRTSSSDRRRRERERASAYATGYDMTSVSAVVAADSTTVSQM